jgi:uncharacterized membrane protein
MSLNEIWPRLHGASTHFPIALALVAGLFEALAIFVGDDGIKSTLRTAATFLVPIAAAGAVVSVVSGLGLAHGELLGAGSLRAHHLFVWPAFGLLVAVSTWRLIAGSNPSPRALVVYRIALWCDAALILAAGYWGGELALSH